MHLPVPLMPAALHRAIHCLIGSVCAVALKGIAIELKATTATYAKILIAILIFWAHGSEKIKLKPRQGSGKAQDRKVRRSHSSPLTPPAQSTG
jgi:hypothetical protein